MLPQSNEDNNVICNSENHSFNLKMAICRKKSGQWVRLSFRGRGEQIFFFLSKDLKTCKFVSIAEKTIQSVLLNKHHQNKIFTIC